MVVMGKMIFKHEMLSEPTFAFVDIETTGGNAQRDRITEIGIRFWRNGVVVGEWQTLLNPEARISGFIERLTGISNAMVASAPRFETIADELERHLDGCILSPTTHALITVLSRVNSADWGDCSVPGCFAPFDFPGRSIRRPNATTWMR